jgi:hypothetical protein
VDVHGKDSRAEYSAENLKIVYKAIPVISKSKNDHCEKVGKNCMYTKNCIEKHKESVDPKWTLQADTNTDGS